MRFDSYHPMINLIYFATTIGFAIWFDHPVFVLVAYISAFAYSVKLKGVRALIFDLCLIPFILGYAAIYSYYNHFGVTELRQNIIGNQITLESVVYGVQIGVTAATVIMLFSCVFAIFTADKVVYLFGKVSPRLSLFLSIALRAVPRIKERAGKINVAQRGIGRGCRQGNILRKVRNAVRLVSMVITWTMEDFVESSMSMKCRGYLLKGRTAFSIYRFDNRDRSFVVAVFLCLTLIGVAVAFDQTAIYYDPQIIMNRITPLSYIFYLAYVVLFLMPMTLQIAGEFKYKQAKKEDKEMVCKL